MPKLEQVKGFSEWNMNELCKNPTENQRKEIGTFTERALEGDYEAVYLMDIKRGIEGDALSHEFT